MLRFAQHDTGSEGNRKSKCKNKNPRLAKRKKANLGHQNQHRVLTERLAAKILGVALGEVLPFFRQVVDSEDGRDRADRDAGAAVNALDRVNLEHLFAAVCGFILLGMDTIHGTCIDTGSVLGSNTRFCDYVSHDFVILCVNSQSVRTTDCSKRKKWMLR